MAADEVSNEGKKRTKKKEKLEKCGGGTREKKIYGRK